jgi:hypothetical protein
MKIAVINFNFERPEMTKISMNNNLKFWNKYSDIIDYFCIFVSGETKKFPKNNNKLVKDEILKIKENFNKIKIYEISNKDFAEDTCFNTFKDIVLHNNYDGCFILEDDIIISSSFFDFGIKAINKLSFDDNFFSINLYGETNDLNFFNKIKKTDCFVPWGFYITKKAIINADKYINELICFKRKNIGSNFDLNTLSLNFINSTNLNAGNNIYLPGILGGDGLLGLISYNKNMNIYSSLFNRAFNIGIMGENNPRSLIEYNDFISKYLIGDIKKDIHGKDIIIENKYNEVIKVDIIND